MTLDALLDAADADLLARLARQPAWYRFAAVAAGNAVAVVGAGKSIVDIGPAHLAGHASVIACNNAANFACPIAKNLGIRTAATTTDKMPTQQVTVHVDDLFVCNAVIDDYWWHESPIVLPDVPYVSPMSSGALAAWVARLAAARSITMVACDAILGDSERWEQWENADYLWHPACTMAMARRTPLTWVCPGRQVPDNPPFHPCPLRKS